MFDISLQSGRFWAMSVDSFRDRLLDFRSCRIDWSTLYDNLDVLTWNTFHGCKQPVTHVRHCQFHYNSSHLLDKHGQVQLMIYTVSQKKQAKLFCYNYVKLPPNLTIFGTMMANCLKLYEVHSFSTSPNSRQCTTVLNADVPNCYITL